MKAVDLFAGCGGLSLGLEKAGINVISAFENWEHAIKIYKQNFNHDVHQCDLSNEKKAIELIKKYKPDMISGGPPCQDFSSAGKRDEKGGRGDLTLSFANIVIGVRPKWFLMENVDRIKTSLIFKKAKAKFTKAGYGLTEIVLDASLCNVPQKRKRMFLIGRENEVDDFLLNRITEKLNSKSITVREYLGDSLKTDYYYRHARSYARRGIFSIDEPSPTIRGVNRPIPPDYKFHVGDATKSLSKVRPLTSVERSYIQTFPKTFKWDGVNKSILEQIIGNAVPVNLAKFVGMAILDYEKKHAK